MDETEIARQYYVLITDLRPDKRVSAFDCLSSQQNEEAVALAGIGKKVFDVIIGMLPAAELERVLREFDSFQPTPYWSGFMETTGQELIRASIAITEIDDAERNEIVGHALRFISRSQDGGFPLSDYSLELLKKVADAGDVNGKAAAGLIARNSLFAPEKKVFKPPKRVDPGPKKKGRLRAV